MIGFSEDGYPKAYALAVYVNDPVIWDCHRAVEEDLEATGRHGREEDYYDGTRITVSEEGELLEAHDPLLDPEVPKHRPANRATAESKLRRDRKHCPLCLARLHMNASRTRLERACRICQAHPSDHKTCRKCGAHAVWENKQAAACQACGAYGGKDTVITSLDE